MTEGVNKELIDKFLYFLRYKYLVEADKKDLIVKGNKNIIERIDKPAQGVKYDWM